MKVLFSRGDDRLARVYVVEAEDGHPVECVESLQPPLPRGEKWVLIVSTLKGCPVGCPICDAGGQYRGKLSAAEILGQVELMARRRYPDLRVPSAKFKVQFARMGDPAFNDAVLEVLERLPSHLDAPGLTACISTVAPVGRERFFERLLEIKRAHYSGGRFQMQFSLHTTDESARRRLVPVRTWSLRQMAAYGERFVESGDRKVTLNFAPAQGLPLDPDVLADVFSPDLFFVKLTPINPTRAAVASGLEGRVDPADSDANRRLVEAFEARGFSTLLSIGELEENAIGSNCGMYVGELAEAPTAACG